MDAEYKLAGTSDGPAQRSTVLGVARDPCEPRGLPEGGQGGRAHGRRRQEETHGHRRCRSGSCTTATHKASLFPSRAVAAPGPEVEKHSLVTVTPTLAHGTASNFILAAFSETPNRFGGHCKSNSTHNAQQPSHNLRATECVQ